MNKKIVSVLLISSSLLLSACGKESQQTVTNAAPNVTTNASSNSGANKADTSVQAVAIDYAKYAGIWKTEEGLKCDSPFGIVVNVNVDKSGNLKGTVGYSSSGFAHISNIEIKGKVENSKFTYNFDEDGWQHGGTIKLDFKDSAVILTIEYDSKSKNINSGWGMYNGTVSLLNSNTPIKRTIADLRKGGWTDVANQCFDVDLNKYGKVKFLSETNWNAGFSFYLQDNGGNIVYKFPEYYATDYYLNNVTKESISAISFPDLNNDGLKDVIILYTGIDVNNTNKVSYCNIFIQKSDGSFENDKALADKVNKSKNNEDIKSIIKFIKDNK